MAVSKPYRCSASEVVLVACDLDQVDCLETYFAVIESELVRNCKGLC